VTNPQIHIDPTLPVIPEIQYTLAQFEGNKKIKLSFTDSGALISDSEKAGIRISRRFITNFCAGKFGHSENLGPDGFIELEDGSPDYISTAFYMLACLQEYDSNVSHDALGRFPYSKSYQSRFKNAHQNIVQHCFDKLSQTLNVPARTTKSRFFLSHDIDLVYGSFLQDGFYALKRGRIDIILRLMMNVAISKPDWLNIDQIMKLESEYDVRSTFFWIVNKSQTEQLKNADYDFKSAKIQNLVNRVEETGFENGIHKSVSSESFQSEISKFQKKPTINRYHYLKFSLPDGFDQVEQSGLKLDASLGFAESIGFRNSYGLPYNPYNLKKRKQYSFLEVPLHVMDTTLFKYNDSDVQKSKEMIFRFFEANKTDCVLSVLWHNNFFTNYKYKGYRELYKSILVYIKESRFETVLQHELSQYAIK